ncbi:hypothetical protein D3C79_680440 [compost metagenome]
MKTIEDHPKIWMICRLDDIPDLFPGVDMPPPGQRLVTDAQIARPSALGQQAQIVDQHLALTQRVNCDVTAHQHQIGAQLLHQVELALGTIEVARQAITTAAFEVTERLKQCDCQP